MKKILLVLSALFLVCSCSSDDPNEIDNGDNETEVSKPVRIGIHVSNQEGNIFDNLQFTLFPDKACTLLDVKETYDSIAWIVPELNGRMRVLEQTDNSSSFKFSWAHSFYNKGRYHTILEGFKDGKIVLSDTIVIHIDSKRDILRYNWKDITETEMVMYGTANVFENNSLISTRKIYENGFPALDIRFRPALTIKTDEERKQFCEQEQEKIAHDYITNLYGKSKLSYDKNRTEALAAYYNERFKDVDSEYTPRYIWETNTSRIVLLQTYDEWDGYHSYFVYAEPNN